MSEALIHVPGRRSVPVARAAGESICWICAEVTPVWQTGLSAETSGTSASVTAGAGRASSTVCASDPIERYVLRLVLLTGPALTLGTV